MDRQIVCLTVPSFELALARLAEPRLRHQPVGLAPAEPHAPHCMKCHLKPLPTACTQA